MFESWLKENIGKLSDDYYGHPQPIPEMLYFHDLDFRTYVRDSYYLRGSSKNFALFDNMFGNPMDTLNNLTIRK